MMENTPARRLGRGLSALLGGGAPAHEEMVKSGGSDLRDLPVAGISRNPFQPRKEFDPESLGELASSIREHGILQPLLVREVDGGFQLIAGERRWQAAQKAGLTTVPCRVVDVIDKTACEFALEENLKRKDLNDLEKAQAFKEYLSHFECTVEELCKQLSMNRSTVTNILRLLDLAEPVKQALRAGRISAGHARSMLSLPEAQQLELCERIQAEHLSVRQTEATVKTLLGRDVKPAEPAPAPVAVEIVEAQPVDVMHAVEVLALPAAAELVMSEAPQGEHTPQAEAASEPQVLPMVEVDPARTHHVESLEGQLRDLLGVPATIKLTGKECGVISVPFSSNDEFERILRTLRSSAAA